MEIKDRLHAKAFGKYHFLKRLPDLSEVYTQFWIEENIKKRGEKKQLVPGAVARTLRACAGVCGNMFHLPTVDQTTALLFAI